MTSKLFAFAALVFLLAGCSGESQVGQDTECVEDGDCPSGFSCEDGLCEGASSVTGDGGPNDPGTVGDGGMTVRAAGVAQGAPPDAVVEVQTEDCTGPTCQIKAGSDVTFTAPMIDGYRFVGWTSPNRDPRCVGTGWTLMLKNVSADIQCTAQYVKRVQVSGATDGLGASVNASSEASFADCSNGASCVVDEGSTVVISASAVSGYRFTGFVGSECSDVEGLSVYVKAGQSDVTCTASYVRSFEVGGVAVGATTLIDVQSDTAFAECISGRCVIDEQGEVTLTAPALDGYRFAGWSGDAACIGSEPTLRIIPVTSNVSCAANYVVRFTATGLATGSPTNPAPSASSSAEFAACVDGTCVVDVGSDVVLSARTIPGYRFTGFSGAGCEDVSGTAVTLTDLAANIVCTAQYVQGISIAGNVVGAPGDVIATSSSPGNNCSAGGCVVDAGGNVTLTAPSPAGYRFTGWTGDAGCTGATQSITLSRVSVSATCSANFVARRNVTFVDPTGGAIVASNIPATASCDADNCLVDNATSLTLTAVPEGGYRFNGWTGCANSQTLQLSLTNISADLTCTASFVRQWSVVYSAGSGGSVSSAQCASGSPCTVDDGSDLAITAVPAAGYRLVSWSGAGCVDSVGSTVNVVDLSRIRSSVTCNATFTRQWSVSYAAGSGGTVSAPGACAGGSPCTVDQGSNLAITASPAAGYRFGGWSGAGCNDSVSGTVNVVDLSNISSNVTCNASFVGQWVVSYAAGTGGSVSAPQCPGGSPCTVDQGSNLAITAAPAAGYRFNGWTGAGCTDSVAATVNVVDLSGISSAVSCNASFTRQWNVSYAAGTGGSVSAPLAQCPAGTPCAVDQGSNLTITAIPASGYRFGGWTGSGCSDSVPGTANAADLAGIASAVSCNASFTRQWNVTYSAGSGGSVSAPATRCPAGSPCTVDAGTDLAITAAPAAGYRFGGWSGSGCTDSAPGTVNVLDLSNIGASLTCTASFVLQGAVVYSAGVGGSVSAPAALCPNASPCAVDQGGSLSITAVPSTGYRFDRWNGAGCSDSNPNTPLVADLTNITTGITCMASFVRQWTISYAANTGGSVSAPTAVCPAGSPCTVDQGANLAITAAPVTGYRFASWSGAGCSDSVPATVNVLDLANIGAAVTCTASFTRQWTVTYAANTGGSVSAPNTQCAAGSPCTLDQGASLAITAAPAAGYRFGSWSGAGCSDSVAGTINVADLTNITSAITCTASFVRQWAVTYSAGSGGSVSAPTAACASGSPCTVDQGANLTITAAPASGYRFDSWSGTGCTDSALATANTADLSNISAAIDCTASFVLQGAVTYSAGSGGSVSAPAARCPNGSPCTVDQGSGLAITAVPSAGYRFGRWTGTGCTDSVPSTPLVVDLANITTGITCTANFVRQWSVTYAADTGGSVSAPSTQCASGSPCTLDQGSNLAVTAVAASGYRFDAWTGTGCTDADSSTRQVADLSNISSAISCTASFVRRVSVTYSATVGGSVSAPSGLCPSGSPCTLDQGNDLSITAAPDSGYRFNGWRGTGCTDSVAGTPLVADLVDLTSDVTCIANFARQWSVTYSANAGGSVSAPSAQCASGSPCSVDQGNNLAVTALPASGFRFGGWGGSNCSDSVPGTVNVVDLSNISAAVTCVASFVRQWSVSYSAGTGGSVSAPSAQCPAGTPCTVDQGSNLAITALPASGYRFNSWTGTNCTDSAPGTADVADLAGINGAIICVASFTRQWAVTYSAGTGGTVSAPSGQCPSGSPCSIDQGTGLAITALPSSGYRFDRWAGSNCSDSVAGTVNVVDLSNVNAAVTCTASFVRRLSVTYSASTGGSVSAPSTVCASGSPCAVDQGSDLTITAAPQTGFRFNGWDGNGCTDSIPGTPLVADLVNITSPVTCVANFGRQWSVTYSANAGGSVSAPNTQCPSGSPCGVDQGNNLAITATPASGYRFGSWIGTNCTDSVPATVNVVDLANISAAVICTANFVRQWSVSYSAGNGGSVSAPSAQCPSGSPCVLDQGANLNVTATPASGYRFSAWAGPNCVDSAAGTPEVANLAGIGSEVTCIASFVQRFTMGAVVSTAGGGSVTATPSGQPACTGNSCTVDQDVPVTLLATPTSAAFRFASWSGASPACVGSNASLTLQNVNATCTANFSSRFTISFPNPAVGSITPSNYAPSSTCRAEGCDVDSGTAIRLTAAPDNASTHRFGSWSGCSTSTNPVLNLANITANATCNANFVRRWNVTFTGAPTGGAVSSLPAATCAAAGANNCVTTVDQGSNVDLTAAPATGHRFVSWSCTDADPATEEVLDLNAVSADLTCNATFVREWTIRFAAEPPGGIVTSSPTAVCVDTGGNNCTLTVDQGTDVDLTASVLAGSGFRFDSWTCTDADTTTPTVLDLNDVAADYTCNASFVRQYLAQGFVSGAPAGNNVVIAPCNNNSCTFDTNSNLTFTAPLVAGFNFTGWTGTGCSDANPDNNPRTLQLTSVASNLQCTANYGTQRVTIAVARAPSSFGQAQVQTPTTGNPVCTAIGTINTSCVVDAGTAVTITASVPSTQADTRFIRWSGGTGCATSNTTQSLTVSSNVTCTAEFYGLWSRTYRVAGDPMDLGYGTLIDSSGHVLVSGIMSPVSSRAWLAQLDEHSGRVMSHAGYTGGGAVQGYGIATNNEGYVITAVGTVAQVLRPFMLGFNKDRELQWVREIPTADGLNDYLTRAAFHPAVGYAGIGYIDDKTRLGHLSAVTADDGRVRFNRRFCMVDPRSCSQTPSCLSTQSVDIVRTERGFAVASQIQDRSNAFYAMLTMFDTDGRTLLELYYRRAGSGETFYDLLPQGLINTPDGGFLMVGRTKELAGTAGTLHDGFAMKLDREGGVEWQTRIGNLGTDEVLTRATVSLDDSEYVLAGYAMGGSQTNDGWFVRLTKDGVIVPDNPNTRINENGNQLYNLGSMEMLYDIVATLDGGYAMTGMHNSLSGDPRTALDLWTMRVDNAGVITFNTAALGTRTVATHVESKLEATGPIKAECVVNEDRFTDGIDRIEEFKKNSTAFTVTETAQAP